MADNQALAITIADDPREPYPATSLTTPGTVGTANHPQIAAMENSGTYVVVWEGRNPASDGGNLSIYIQRFRLEAPGETTRTDEVPQVAALGPNGAFAVTWRGETSGGDAIFIQRFAADGTLNGVPVSSQAPGASGGSSDDVTPQVAAIGDSGAYANVVRHQLRWRTQCLRAPFRGRRQRRAD